MHFDRDDDRSTAEAVSRRIFRDRVDLYEPPAQANDGYYYSPEQLEAHLTDALVGADNLADLPVRTRSKVAKSIVAKTLGYAVPSSFEKTQPRFPHANLDVYVQKSNNLQVWNAEVDAARRYVIIGLDADERVHAVRVIAGADLALYDTTGTLTRKYQASRRAGGGSQLVSELDTADFIEALDPTDDLRDVRGVSPVARPQTRRVLSIAATFDALLPLVGRRFEDPGATQERLRGVTTHAAACEALTLSSFADNGTFPDILSQAIEVKLQLARTVDLGLELPDSPTPVASLDGRLSARDVRYAIFYAERDGSASFQVTALVLTTGASFFEEFQQFGGRVINSKIQLRLPTDFFA